LVGNDSLLNHTGCKSHGTAHPFHQDDTLTVSASCGETLVTVQSISHKEGLKSLVGDNHAAVVGDHFSDSGHALTST
jgi:membrane-bound inhibitor of C-type lysozyme